MYKDMFTQGMSLRQIEKETGIPRKRISRLLKEEGIEVKARSKGTTGKRKYQMNEDLFEAIDTKEKAYWLGFLYADGYVGFNKLEVGLAIKDIGHLEKFRQFLKTDAPIGRRMIKESQACRINICSTKLVNDLEKHGCTQAKSLTLQWPQLSPGLYSHFMRGYFDGDGCCYRRKDGQLCWSLLGTEEFLSEYQKVLINLGLSKTSMRLTKTHGQAYEIRYSGNNIVKKIEEFLYQDSTVHLERKCHLTAVQSGN